MTLKMTTAQVIDTSVTVNNKSPIQDYAHPDDQTQPTFEMTPGFKPFTVLALSNPYLSQSCQRIYPATLSCLPLYSVCASLPHSLTTWATVSSLLSHILHKLCCVINMKSRIICSQSLFLGAIYQGLSTSFEISFCNPLPSSIPVSTFLFSHILPMHSFLLPSILRLLYLIHFVLLWVHSL